MNERNVIFARSCHPEQQFTEIAENANVRRRGYVFHSSVADERQGRRWSPWTRARHTRLRRRGAVSTRRCHRREIADDERELYGETLAGPTCVTARSVPRTPVSSSLGEARRAPVIRRLIGYAFLT